MKERSKAGLVFGLFMAVYFLSGTIIDLIRGTEVSGTQILKEVIIALISGAIAGVLFGFLMGRMTNRLIKKINIDLEPGEVIELKTGANHWKGPECTGGALFLTNKRLVFKSHRVNVQNHLFELSIPEISAVKRYKSAGIIDNGLLLTTTEGKEEKFVVEKAGEWAERLYLLNRENVMT